MKYRNKKERDLITKKKLTTTALKKLTHKEQKALEWYYREWFYSDEEWQPESVRSMNT
jgi:hypothetical protein